MSHGSALQSLNSVLCMQGNEYKLGRLSTRRKMVNATQTPRFGNYTHDPSLSQDFVIFRALGITILVLISAVGSAANIFIIVASIVSRREIRPIHILLVHLAATDLLICALFTPMLTYSLEAPIPIRSDLLCNLIFWAYPTCVAMVIGTQFAITLNRYASYNINHRWSRRLLSVEGAFISIYASWLSVGILFLLPIAAYNNLLCYDFALETCKLCGDISQLKYGIIIAMASLLVIFSVIFSMYLRIAISFKKMQNRVLEKTKKTNKISKNTAVLLIVFAVCYGPAVITELYDFEMSEIGAFVVDTLYRLNAMVNPFLYAYRLPLYKHAFRKWFGRHRKVGAVTSGVTSLPGEQ